MAAAGIIAEETARLVVGPRGEERPHPILSGPPFVGRAVVRRCHAQHIPDGQPCQLGARAAQGELFGKVIHDMVVQIEIPFGAHNADSQRHKAFRLAVHTMQRIFCEWCRVPFADQRVMPHDQQAVQRHPTLSQIIKRLAEGRTGHANFLRLCYGKLHTAHPVLPTRFFSKAINAGSPGMMGSYPLLKISTLGKSSVSAPACLACRYSA